MSWLTVTTHIPTRVLSWDGKAFGGLKQVWNWRKAVESKCASSHPERFTRIDRAMLEEASDRVLDLRPEAGQVRAALYLRVSMTRQAEADLSRSADTDQRLLRASWLACRRGICRTTRLGHG